MQALQITPYRNSEILVLSANIIVFFAASAFYSGTNVSDNGLQDLNCLGTNNIFHALYEHKLARKHEAMCDYAREQSLLAECLRTYESLLGASHRLSLVARLELASVHLQQYDYREAKKLVQKGLSLLSDKNEKDGMTLDYLEELAIVYRQEGDAPQAEILYRKILRSAENGGFFNKDRAVRFRHGLESLYWDQERFEEADRLFREDGLIQQSADK